MWMKKICAPSLVPFDGVDDDSDVDGVFVQIDDTGGGNVLLCKSLYESRENFTFSPGKAGTLITAVTTDNGEECGVLFIRN